MSETMQRIEGVEQALRAHFGDEAPRWVMVLGSGVGRLSQDLGERVAVPYAELGIPSTHVSGHAGEVVVGRMGDVRVACLSGRNHLYEGHSPARSVLGLRAALLWGAQRVLLTSSVGSLRAEWPAGSIVAVSDHINFIGVSPLQGPNLPAFGPRFPDMSELYSPALRRSAIEAAQDLGAPLHQGVYCAMPGPAYETPAEIRMLRVIGADLVGMSIVNEAAVAAHAGRPLIAFCIVANLAAGMGEKLLDHESLTSAVSGSVAQLVKVVRRLVRDS